MDEIHHIHKLDSPSGTGLSLANQIIENIDRKTQWTAGYENNPENIAIHSRRIGMTPGTHGINYRSNIDTIEIKHTAHSRQGFALGAVIAAEWMQDKKGYFTMKDVLGI